MLFFSFTFMNNMIIRRKKAIFCNCKKNKGKIVSICWEKWIIFSLKQNPNRATREIILNKKIGIIK